MADIEKTIKGLETCIKHIDQECPIDCPYYEKCTKYEGRVVFQPVLRDTLALLKEQREEIENLKQTAQSMMEGICLLKEHEEIVHPEPSCEMEYITDCCCDLCGVQLIREDNFCRCCGRRIEWEGQSK